MRERLEELLEIYRRMYMGELLTEGAERIAFLDGMISGLELALEVAKGDN